MAALLGPVPRARSLAGAPGVGDLSSLDRETLIFEGGVEEAVRLFPKNINIAALLSVYLKGIKLKVRIVVDPAIERNIHQIQLEGDFGRIEVRCENLPSVNNPKTSYLAILSAKSTLREAIDQLYP